MLTALEAADDDVRGNLGGHDGVGSPGVDGGATDDDGGSDESDIAVDVDAEVAARQRGAQQVSMCTCVRVRERGGEGGGKIERRGKLHKEREACGRGGGQGVQVRGEREGIQ